MNAKEQIAALTAEVNKAVTVEKSAKALIDGFNDRLKSAVDAALANGATAEELQPLTDLGTALDGASDDLATSVTANTPAAA